MKFKVSYTGICMVAIIGFYCLWYLFSSFENAAELYLQINPHFYKSYLWKDVFFTQQIKTQGNYYACIVFLSSFILVFKNRENLNFKQLYVTLKTYAFPFCVAGIIAIVLCFFSYHSVYAYDEVFSAQNFAKAPFFHCISYYAEPNNHILFNAINHFNQFWTSDLVFSGRLLSMSFYFLSLCITYLILIKFINYKWLIWSMILFLSVQFTALGFATQARGYSMILFLSLLSFYTFIQYFFYHKTTFLYLHTLVNALAMFTIPTFAYWWMGLIISALIIQFYYKKISFEYFFSLGQSLVLVLIFYTPILTFSGIKAIIANKWTQSTPINYIDFLVNFTKDSYFNGYFNETFLTSKLYVGLFLILLPCAFFFSSNINLKKIILLYFLILFGFLLITIGMKKLPFYRNLIAHGYLIWMIILLSFSLLFFTHISKIVLAFALTLTSIYFLNTNMKSINASLYYYDIDASYEDCATAGIDFKTNSTVFLDDNSFYWPYMIQKTQNDKKLKIIQFKTAFDNQDYCIIASGNPNKIDLSSYIPLASNTEDYQFYKKILF